MTDFRLEFNFTTVISVAQASGIILENLYKPSVEVVSVHLAADRLLAQDILADTDLPPFDRVMMDGIALRFEDFEGGLRRFQIRGMQRAGQEQQELSEPFQCLEVMTGAVCPKGTDTVVPYEDITVQQDECVIHVAFLKKGQNIHRRATDKHTGEVLVAKNKKIGPAEIAVAASTGHNNLQVYSFPRVHIFSTGDELVEINETPQAHQLRRSNVYALQQILLSQGITTTQSHLADDEHDITTGLEKAFQQNDVILLSGGVSRGKYDLVPAVMQSLGVEMLFHRIAQKPGKPMWFGRKHNTYVFAFPGNPVSTFLCAVRYLLPWLNASLGQPDQTAYARIDADFSYRQGLTYFLQVKLSLGADAMLTAAPVAGGGSGDFANLVEADAFLELPAEKNLAVKGQVFQCYLYR